MPIIDILYKLIIILKIVRISSHILIPCSIENQLGRSRPSKAHFTAYNDQAFGMVQFFFTFVFVY